MPENSASRVLERTSITAATHSITLQQELRRCGSSGCRSCPHGPYWYAYWKDGRRTRSAYVGKTLDHDKARAAVAKVQQGKARS